MIVGVLRLTLHLPNSESLKARRHVVAGLLVRIRRKFGVAAAEVGEGKQWQIAEIAVACLSTENAHADQILSAVAAFTEANAGEAILSEVQTELIRL